ncbi:unnamed protein product [Ranitomeya imitator]|uniref:Uncharacterized protein n=1 Tax=Ranitomeya imitator TaxID=111125 RepID=A0ABN9LD15_9NEOB|nr:unnamed protein product [Ranitomeya imitator]
MLGIIKMFSGKIKTNLYVLIAQQLFSSWSTVMQAIFAQSLSYGGIMNTDLKCKGASHYGLNKERKRRSQDGSPDCSSSLDLTIAAVSSELSAASAPALVSDETGQDNPVYSSPTGDSHLGGGSEEHCRINRNRSRNFERSTVRSLSFKKLNRALSVLRRTKSGSAVMHSTDRERGILQNANVTEDCIVLPSLTHLIPDGEITCIKINRSDPSECLGIRIVGGNETPLTQIIIQHTSTKMGSLLEMADFFQAT